MNDDIEPECYPCVVRQALRTAQMAELDIDRQRQVVDEAMKGLLRRNSAPWTTLHIGRRVADRATRLASKWIDHDIYSEPKEHANEVARSFEDRLRRDIREAKDPLAMAIRVATAGNIIDFGAKDHATLDLQRECEAIGVQPFGHFDLESFRTLVESADDLLYICDNAGEIVFDTLLMEVLHELRPKLLIHAAFRERPILNDATIEDAQRIGMRRVANLMSSGSVYAGTPLADCSDLFRKRFLESDVVVSKGQGNFSTLRHDGHERLFFALRIKCATIARLTGLELDTLQFIQATHLP